MSTQTKALLFSIPILLLLFGAFFWFFFLRSAGSTPAPVTAITQFFGVGGNVTGPTATGGTGTGETPNTPTQPPTTSGSVPRVFQLAAGPVTNAIFVQTFSPTTTVVRYVQQDTGHILELPVDVPGAAARTLSNTTIPGISRAVWANKGSGVLLQYAEKEVVKTVYVDFSSALSTSSIQKAPRLQFLVNNISSLAVSPDGTKVVFLVPSTNGSVGYVANADGTQSKKLFSLPLAELNVSWPSTKTLLVQTKPAVGVSGIVFSISPTSGAFSELVYAPGITATANTSFSKLVYQKVGTSDTSRTTYVHDVVTGKDSPLSFNPFPEKCGWGSVGTTTLYCMSPLGYVEKNYSDRWYIGFGATTDALFQYDLVRGVDAVLAIPGNKTDGGGAADAENVSVSPDDQYLAYVSRGARSLWAVRLK